MLILNIFPLHTNLAGVGERAVGGGADGVECGGAYGGADLQAFRIVLVDHNSGLHFGGRRKQACLYARLGGLEHRA